MEGVQRDGQGEPQCAGESVWPDERDREQRQFRGCSQCGLRIRITHESQQQPTASAVRDKHAKQ